MLHTALLGQAGTLAVQPFLRGLNAVAIVDIAETGGASVEWYVTVLLFTVRGSGEYPAAQRDQILKGALAHPVGAGSNHGSPTFSRRVLALLICRVLVKSQGRVVQSK